MADKDREFRQHLLATFRIEAGEHLRSIGSSLIEMEKTGAPERKRELIEAVFRMVHSLKGASRSVGNADVEAFCQAMEGLFAALKRGEVTLSSELFDLLHQATDCLGLLLSGTDADPGAGKGSNPREILQKLRAFAVGDGPKLREDGMVVEKPPAATTEPSPAGGLSPLRMLEETVRVPTAKLSAMLLQSEEMLAAKLAASQQVTRMRETSAAFHSWKKEWARTLPDLRRIKSRAEKTVHAEGECPVAETSRELLRILDFLEWNSNFIATLERNHDAAARRVKYDSLTLGGMVNNLLGTTKTVLLFPFSSLLESFPRIVRDLSREHGKDVELVIQGGEIEIDRRILAEMKDPLVHMVRNCVDHGIERPEVRRLKNKPKQGTMTITVSPKDDKVEVIVADDGAGIPLDRIRSAMLKLGLASREKLEELSDRELLSYVFHSGVSTSPIITELSGRGLGLAIVRENVEKLGGTVSLETVPDVGTRFRMVIPLTVATFRGILVRMGERIFVIPTMYVARATRLKRDAIKTVENREAITLNGEVVSLARLADVLELSLGNNEADVADFLPAVVLAAAGTCMAFLVDEVLDEQEVLLKGLGRQLPRVRNVAGATVLGSGRLVPILNVPDLLQSAVKVSSRPSLSGVSGKPGGAASRKWSVMIAEDSITTRYLLRNILEAAGYDVMTAVDGLDALTRLKSAACDIVVSDVDMPRMNGFDLTARIRADKKLCELPVVLVTALDSREDRERGIDVGASAYIVKSSFDQSNLLDVIKRFV